jgi:proteasome lid subunit RPN8/RPN11
MQLNLKPRDWLMMRDHVQVHAPLEACGLLAGKNDSVEKVLLINNEAQSPIRFRMNPKEQLNAFAWIESNGLDLVGIFHSHPSGPETLSPTDIAESAYGVAQIVWSRTNGEWNARGFWVENKQMDEIILNVIE